MKKMIYLAAFAIMMAIGNMDANAKAHAKHNDKGRVEMPGNVGHKVYAGHRNHNAMSHERRMAEERRRREEMRRRNARHHHHTHHCNVVACKGSAVAGIAAGVAVATIIGALIN